MAKCGCRQNPYPPFHRGEYQDLWNRMFDALPKLTQAQMLKKGGQNRKIVTMFNQIVLREWEKQFEIKKPSMRPNPAGQEVITRGNRAVVINKQGDRVWANLYVNARDAIQNADITRLRWTGKTVEGARKWAEKQFASNPVKRQNPSKKKRRFTFVKGGGLLDRKTGKIRYFRRRKILTGRMERSRRAAETLRPFRKNPLRIRRLPSGKFRVGSGTGRRGRVHAKATTRLRAMRQASLIRGIKRGWRPTGRPARDVRRRLKQIKRRSGLQQIFGVRHGHRWTIRTKPGGGRVIAHGLTLDQLRARARKAGYKVRSL